MAAVQSPTTNGSTDIASHQKTSRNDSQQNIMPLSGDYLAMDIIIVGAGIGGLTAALACRQQGHTVTLLEQSKFSQELGAAVHLASNANGVLRKLGIKPEEFGANHMTGFSECKADGSILMSMPVLGHLWQHPHQLAHRVRLHQKLRLLATGTEGSGTPAKLHTSSRVANIDCSKGVVKTEDGTEYKGDLIIGADGVHSITRQYVQGGHIKPFDSGKSAFRFMLPASVVTDDPVTSKFTAEPGKMFMIFAPDRRIIMYPTNDNKELNFVCIHPSEETKANGDWNNETTMEHLLDVYKDFDSSIKAMLAKADPTTLKTWNLLDMDKLPTFFNERLVLIGDAAHPFTPHQGQGAGMAIEDGASLAVMLSEIQSLNELPERLALYEKARYERAHTIQHFSRVLGQDLKNRTEPVDMARHTIHNLGYDEVDNSTRMLREWQWSRMKVYWRQPVGFGPMPGPRQSFTGAPRDTSQSTSSTISIKFKTSRTLLQNLFPPNRTGLTFESPSTYAHATISIITLDKMEWLGGKGYSYCIFAVEGVKYTKKDGDVVRGSYIPVLFENLADAITTGREELGMPKLYSDIDVHSSGDSASVKTSWRGAAWGDFQLSGLEELDVPQATGSDGEAGQQQPAQLVYRSMPTVGGPEGKGNAAEEFFAYYTPETEKVVPKVTRVRKATTTEFKLDGLDWTALPTIHHVIARLAELPVYEIAEAKVVDAVGVGDLSNFRRIE